MSELAWWSEFADNLHEASVNNEVCLVEDPNDWLAWPPLLSDMENGDIHPAEMASDSTVMRVVRERSVEIHSQDVPQFNLSAESIFPNLDYDVINELSVSLLDTLYPHHPETGPIRGHEETCSLILQNVFGVDLDLLPFTQVASIISDRQSAVPPSIVEFVERRIGRTLEEMRVGESTDDNITVQPLIDPTEERWSSLRTYLEDAEVVGRVIHGAWQGDKAALSQLETLQKKFVHSLDDRPRLGRTLRAWPASVELVAQRMTEGWTRADEVRALLVVLDCCSLPLGSLLLDEIRRAEIPLHQARATLAQEPTLTSISRKSIAAGRAPETDVEDSEFKPLHSTSPEDRLWRSFWHERFDVSVQTYRVVNAERKMKEVQNHLDASAQTSLFIVFNELDHLVHASSDVVSLENSDMVVISKRWMQGSLIPFLRESVDKGWRVVVTSDHGCTRVQGCVDVDLGDRTLTQAARSVDIREMGERVIWPRAPYADSLASDVDGRLISVAGEPCILLPPGKVSPKGNPFGFAHGGISLEELVVPYLELGKW